MKKKALQIIFGVAVIGFLMGVISAHFINAGFFSRWKIISLPPNQTAQHFFIQSNPLAIQVATASGQLFTLHSTYTEDGLLVALENPGRLLLFGQCQKDSLLDSYYVADLPGRVTDQIDCRLLGAGDRPLVYRLAILEDGQLWQWVAAADSFTKVIVYIGFGLLGLLPSLFLLVTYLWSRSNVVMSFSAPYLDKPNKLSIKDPQFLQPLEDYLREEPLVVWHQLAWMGGQQGWFLVTTTAGLQKVLSTGQRASAFTVYHWLPHSQPYVVNEDWVTQMYKIIEEDVPVPNHFILVMPAFVKQNTNGFYPLEWLCAEDLHEYLAENQGEKIVVGQIPNFQNGEIKRGYMPNQDGIPESGPY